MSSALLCLAPWRLCVTQFIFSRLLSCQSSVRTRSRKVVAEAGNEKADTLYVSIRRTNLECPLKSMRYQNVEGGSGAGRSGLEEANQPNWKRKPGKSAESSEI